MRKVIVSLNREEALACVIALEKEKPYGWQQDALKKLMSARMSVYCQAEKGAIDDC